MLKFRFDRRIRLGIKDVCFFARSDCFIPVEVKLLAQLKVLSNRDKIKRQFFLLNY